MKSWILAGAALLLPLTWNTAVAAADIPVKKAARPMAPVVVAASPWAGFYLGGHAGYGSAKLDGVLDSSENFAPFEAFGKNLHNRGFLGGVQAGYFWQSGAWVYGPELSASFMNWTDQTRDADFSGDLIDSKVKNLLIANAKLGYAFNNMLVFGAIGAARADVKWSPCDECGSVDESRGSLKLDKWGLALGAGVEMALYGPWTFGVEGTYVHFDGRKSASNLTPDSDSTDFAELKHIWTVKGVINYRFNAPPPP